MKTESMPAELRDQLTAYISGRKSVEDVGEFLTSIDWDDRSLEPPTRAVLGNLELLATEASEGLRDESELKRYAEALIAKESAA